MTTQHSQETYKTCVQEIVNAQDVYKRGLHTKRRVKELSQKTSLLQK